MFGTNPKTGKPIRILKSEATIWRNQKTTVWYHEDFSPKQADRYEVVCLGLQDYRTAIRNHVRVDALILPSATPEAVEFLRAKHLHQHLILFMGRAIALAIGEKDFMALRLTNVVCLEEIHQIFPFVGREIPWNETPEDAVTLAALIMRSVRVFGIDPAKLHTRRMEHLKATGISLSTEAAPQIPQLWFLTQYYRPEKGRREREIKKCLEMNVKSPVVDKIILLNEKDFSDQFPADPQQKIQQVVVGKRLTYAMVIKWFQENAPQNTICVFANSDIYMDDSSKVLWTTNLEDKFLSLLRYDVQENGTEAKLFGPRPDSQDTWIFSSNSIQSRTFNWADLEFPFGKAGCDNAINVEMLRKKFLIVNPALSIKTYHLHTSGLRTYDPSDIVDKPMYFYVEPTGIHDMEPITDLSKYIAQALTSATIERRLTGPNEKAIDTFCTMLEKQETFHLKRNEANLYTETPAMIRKYINVFHTCQGLLYDTRRIYVGGTETMQKAWSEARLSPLLPSFHAKKTCSVYLPPEVTKSAEAFLLYSVSRVLQLRAREPDAEFWAPQSERILEALQAFRWGTKSNVPVLPIAPNAQVWADEVIEWSAPDSELLRKEDIETLRRALQMGWSSSPVTPGDTSVYAIMVDDFCNAEWVQELETQLPGREFLCFFAGRTSPTRILERIRERNVEGMIFFGGPKSEERWGWNWALPKGASIIELQNEMEPDGYATHMSALCEQTHNLITFPRAKPEFQRKETIRQVIQVLQGTPKAIAPNLPVLYMPRKSLTGFFGHPGDSFREMARLWADAGLVQLVEHPTAVQIWIGEVGDCLLYDRPTMEWLQAAPPTEQLWKKALFGNPTPFGTNSSPWFFWPRRPSFVEELVGRGDAQRSYTNRSKRLVFYGKIENRVQERRRTGSDWAAACDEFVMPKGDEKPYVFTQKEYLERLADAKFGLCLAGYGKKCHREVECMAMGTVPIVATEVDISSYANPPQEGVHFFRVNSPEEAKQVSEETSEERWATMSAACHSWWKENCSVQGSWALTKKLLELS